VSDAQLYVRQEQASGPLPLRWRLIVIAAWIAALAALAFTLAHWTWRWLGPSPAAVPPAAPAADPAQSIADAHLFGAARTAAAGPAVASSAIGELRLLGVFAQRDGAGYALFRAGARGPLLVAAGQDLGSGVRLESVRPDGVTLSEGGVRHDIALRPTTTTGERPRAVAAATPKPASACAAPAGFAGPILRINAELLDGMMQTPDAWKALVEPAAGALIVRDQSGFAGMLGLKNGDRVERANGIALAIPADIPSTVLQPLTRSQPVWLAGTRDGKAQQWLYLNAGACPG